MNRKAVFNEISKGLAAILVIFLILETLLRIAYFGRNSMVTEIPIPYMFGDDHGPIPFGWMASGSSNQFAQPQVSIARRVTPEFQLFRCTTNLRNYLLRAVFG